MNIPFLQDFSYLQATFMTFLEYEKTAFSEENVLYFSKIDVKRKMILVKILVEFFYLFKKF